MLVIANLVIYQIETILSCPVPDFLLYLQKKIKHQALFINKKNPFRDCSLKGFLNLKPELLNSSNCFYFVYNSQCQSIGFFL
ncbi:hypothetical protein SAMN05443549_10795 [Flavobacterium fluvii]|uniref:Uncharacterized protein n=1 Tax=Flavobacterium fluvii TaxID=468056 RepID=A0A1M5N3F9_9FLAO|nr:hypothetical protein SAMN05443549_10795 [Flavobacterium fluvii]